LKAGEEQTVTFNISIEDLKFFDDKIHKWIAEKGKFTAFIGSSSADIKESCRFELK
jgi:beta-glucosidase